jgi:hypothetical protein
VKLKKFAPTFIFFGSGLSGLGLITFSEMLDVIVNSCLSLWQREIETDFPPYVRSE